MQLHDQATDSYMALCTCFASVCFVGFSYFCQLYSLSSLSYSICYVRNICQLVMIPCMWRLLIFNSFTSVKLYLINYHTLYILVLGKSFEKKRKVLEANRLEPRSGPTLCGTLSCLQLILAQACLQFYKITCIFTSVS